MSRFFILALILNTVLLFSGCSSTPAVLLRADKYTNTNPDSALYLLKHVEPSILKNQHDSALYNLLLIEANNKCRLAFEPEDTVINYSIAYFTKHPEGNRLAYCYLYRAKMQKEGLNYGKAMTDYLKALDVMKDSHDYTLLADVAYDQGEISMIQGDLENSRLKYTKAYNYFNKAGNHDMAFYAIMDVGTSFFNEKKYNKAISDYKKIEPLATDSLTKGALYQQMGLVYYYLDKDSSLKYYRQAIHYPCVKGDRAIRYLMIGSILFTRNEIDSSQYYIQKALTYPSSMETRMSCYKMLTNTCYRLDDMQGIRDYMHLYLAVNDSINNINNQPHATYLESLHTSLEERSGIKSANLYLFIAIALVLIFSVIVFRLMRERSKKEKQLADETHNQQKVKIRQDIIQSKREALQDKINQIKTVHEPDKKQYNIEEKEQKVWQMYDELLHISDLPFFYKEMDTVLNHLVTKLQNRYEKINDKELCWCCLSLLDVPNYDMLILLHYNSDTSLKKMKTRLADKLHIENASGLSDFLNKILSED